MSLYMSKEEKVHELCDIRIQKAKNFITSLNSNAFLIHHQNPVSAVEFCWENHLTKTNTFQLDVLERVEVKSNCYLQLPSARLYSISQIQSEAKIETFRWAIKFSKFIKGLEPDKINSLVKSFQDNNQKLPPLDPFMAKALHHDLMEAAKPHYTNHWSFRTNVGISLAALLIGFILVILVVGAGVYKRRRSQRLRMEAAAQQINLRNGFVDQLMVNQPLMPGAIPPN